MMPDLTTERGRAQAHAMGGALAWACAQVEAALAADAEDRQFEASEVLSNTSWDIMTEGRQEFIEMLLDDLDSAYTLENLDEQKVARERITELLTTMRREQLILNDMLGLVQAHLDGHNSAVDLKGAIAKVQEKYRETDD